MCKHSLQTIYSYASYQFNDYSKYEVMEGTEEYRRGYRDNELPNDLNNAYELGKRLVEKAKEFNGK